MIFYYLIQLKKSILKAINTEFVFEKFGMRSMQTLSESPGENWCYWIFQKAVHHHQMIYIYNYMEQVVLKLQIFYQILTKWDNS